MSIPEFQAWTEENSGNFFTCPEAHMNNPESAFQVEIYRKIEHSGWEGWAPWLLMTQSQKKAFELRDMIQRYHPCPNEHIRVRHVAMFRETKPLDIITRETPMIDLSVSPIAEDDDDS